MVSYRVTFCLKAYHSAVVTLWVINDIRSDPSHIAKKPATVNVIRSLAAQLATLVLAVRL